MIKSMLLFTLLLACSTLIAFQADASESKKLDHIIQAHVNTICDWTSLSQIESLRLYGTTLLFISLLASGTLLSLRADTSEEKKLEQIIPHLFSQVPCWLVERDPIELSTRVHHHNYQSTPAHDEIIAPSPL